MDNPLTVQLLVLGGGAATVLGIAVVAALRLASRAYRTSGSASLYLTLNVMGWILVAVGLLVVAVAILSVLGVFLWTGGLVIILAGRFKYRVAQQYALLWTLAVSAERFIPLVPALEAVAWESRGLFAYRVRRLAALLGSGVALPDALRQSQKILPDRAIPIISVGYESGALAAALRRAIALREYQQPVWETMMGKLAYVCLVPLFGAGVFTYVMLWIVPKFQKIFADFAAELPPMTRSLVGTSYWVSHYWFLFIWLWLVPLAILVYASLRYMGWVQWDLPGVGRVTRRLDAAVILDALALGAQHDRPLPETLETLAQSYQKEAIRTRLVKVLEDVRAGADWCDSLRGRGLIKQADAAVLQAAQRAGNLPWALQEMADSNRRRLAYRLYAVLQVMFPPVVLLFGLLVLLIVVAMFLPLVSLIQKLA
jgi:type II secretory pathway component PulF